MNKILKIIIAAFAIIIILLVSVAAAFMFDAASLTATSSQTLNPDDTQIGRALVVYNPGFSGAAKAVAEKIATELQTKGYSVDLAGTKSETAQKNQDYEVVAVGGPMYWGQAASSVDSFLKASTLQPQAKLGVYVTTGFSQFNSSDYTSLQQQVASATGNRSPIAYGMILDGNETQNCADFVSALLQ